MRKYLAIAFIFISFAILFASLIGWRNRQIVPSPVETYKTIIDKEEAIEENECPGECKG